jgi:hypothetical protein
MRVKPPGGLSTRWGGGGADNNADRCAQAIHNTASLKLSLHFPYFTLTSLSSVMDPISITCAVASIAAHSFTATKTLITLRERYKHAHVTIQAICAETQLVSSSLGRIQGLALSNPNTFDVDDQSRSELEHDLDVALTGCLVVFSVLDDEVQKLVEKQGTVTGRSMVLWDEGRMTGLLGHIRGQQTALTLLFQALQL